MPTTLQIAIAPTLSESETQIVAQLLPEVSDSLAFASSKTQKTRNAKLSANIVVPIVTNTSVARPKPTAQRLCSSQSVPQWFHSFGVAGFLSFLSSRELASQRGGVVADTSRTGRTAI